jgi:hypothetical protein
MSTDGLDHMLALLVIQPHKHLILQSSPDPSKLSIVYHSVHHQLPLPVQLPPVLLLQVLEKPRAQHLRVLEQSWLEQQQLLVEQQVEGLVQSLELLLQLAQPLELLLQPAGSLELQLQLGLPQVEG